MKSKKIKYIVLIVVIFLFLLTFIIASGNRKNEKPLEKNKQYVTLDNRVTITSKESFKKKEISNYDLYLTKNDKQIVGFFTYLLNEYEENSSKEILDRQISYFANSRKDFKLFKKENIIELDDKKITKVEYSGSNKDSSKCVYVFAVIDFVNDPNYVVYANEVILQSEYEKNIGEMIDILKSAKLN